MINSVILRKLDTFSKISKLTEATPVISVTTSRFVIPVDETKEMSLQLNGNIDPNGILNIQTNQSTGVSSDEEKDFIEEWNELWNNREIRRDRLRLLTFSNRNNELFSNDRMNNLGRRRYRTLSFGTKTDRILDKMQSIQ